MATRLFKDGEPQLFDANKVQGALAAGWSVEKVEGSDDGEEEQKEVVQEGKKLTNEEIREKAFDAGIETWETSRIATLKEKLGME